MKMQDITLMSNYAIDQPLNYNTLFVSLNNLCLFGQLYIYIIYKKEDRSNFHLWSFIELFMVFILFIILRELFNVWSSVLQQNSNPIE